MHSIVHKKYVKVQTRVRECRECGAQRIWGLQLVYVEDVQHLCNGVMSIQSQTRFVLALTLVGLNMMAY
jgi:hypothetical protein